MSIQENNLFKKLISLKLPFNDFAVFGSGPLFAYGLTKEVRDIDLIARGAAWKNAVQIQKPEIYVSGKGMLVKLFDDSIEIYNEWCPGEWNISELIDTAEVIEKIKFVNLKNVLRWKKLRKKEKDLKHIKLIEDYLKSEK